MALSVFAPCLTRIEFLTRFLQLSREYFDSSVRGNSLVYSPKLHGPKRLDVRVLDGYRSSHLAG